MSNNNGRPNNDIQEAILNATNDYQIIREYCRINAEENDSNSDSDTEIQKTLAESLTLAGDVNRTTEKRNRLEAEFKTKLEELHEKLRIIQTINNEKYKEKTKYDEIENSLVKRINFMRKFMLILLTKINFNSVESAQKSLELAEALIDKISLNNYDEYNEN